MKTIHIFWRDLLRQVRLLTLLAFFAAIPLHAQVPSLINYQGRLTDAEGNPVTGNRTMVVRVYDAPTAGNMTYQEPIGTVVVTNGTYSFQFGDEGDGVLGVLNGGSSYLALSVNGTEESTRSRLLAVPYALKAKKSEDAQALAQQVGELEVETTKLGTDMETVAVSLSANLTAVKNQVQSVSESLGGLLAQFKVVGLSGSLEFGNSTTGGSLEITNSGFGRLTVTGIEYPESFSGDWNGGIINQGGSVLVNVTFAPTAVRSFSGNIVVTSDATSGTGSIPVSGQGTRLIALNGALAFGSVTVNNVSKREFTISNLGTMDLNVNGINYPPGFSGNWSGTIAPGGSQNVAVQFMPTAELAYGGNVSVISNASSANAHLALSGSGVVAGTPTANMINVQGGALPSVSQLAGQSVASFQIGKYEVTWAEWQEVSAWAVPNGYSDLENVGAGISGNHPVEGVSWYDVVKWCNARSERDGLIPVYESGGSVFKTGQIVPTANNLANGYRLPTEAEWEWAARGGVASQAYIYSGSNNLDAVAWHGNNSGGVTKPVGTKAANELEIYDMTGNVWEWCEDSVDIIYRRMRGGGCASGGPFITVANSRDYGLPFPRGNSLGFRLARSSGN
jgi:formylglycine-generating enzyme required for sulfatase activity